MHKEQQGLRDDQEIQVFRGVEEELDHLEGKETLVNQASEPLEDLEVKEEQEHLVCKGSMETQGLPVPWEPLDCLGDPVGGWFGWDFFAFSMFGWCGLVWYTWRDVNSTTLQNNKLQYNKLQYNKLQYNKLQYNTINYNTINYNTINYNTINYNTIEYTTIR